MSNMSHCRFENTYKDLVDCLDALEESGDIREFIESRNDYEKPYVKKLVELCKEISTDFWDDVQ